GERARAVSCPAISVKREVAFMAYGPVEMLVVKFPGNQFSGELAPALQDLVDTGLIRVIDFLFVLKDSDGAVFVYEQNGLGDEVAALLEPISQPEDELLSQEDAESIGVLLEPNSSAALLLFENAWAAQFAQALRNANGEVIINSRIPRDVIEAIVEDAELAGERAASSCNRRNKTMLRRRGGRGIIGAMATTALVAGTAGAVAHHQQQRYPGKAAAQRQEMGEQQAAAESQQQLAELQQQVNA